MMKLKRSGSMKCKNIELYRRSTEQTMNKYIEGTSRKKKCSSAGCHKSKKLNGNIILKQEKILDRCAEYISEVFEDHRKDYHVMKRKFSGPSVMKDETRAAIRKVKLDKARGPDSMSVELLEAFEDYGINKIKHCSTKSMTQVRFHQTSRNLYLLHYQRNQGQSGSDQSYESYHQKSLRIIMMRVRNKIKLEIAEEHLALQSTPFEL